MPSERERQAIPIFGWRFTPACHAYNWTGGIAETIDDDFRRRSLFWKTSGVWVDRATQKEIPVSYRWLLKNCIDRGQPYRVGGDRRVKTQSSADLLQFLRDVGIIADAAAKAIVPDCNTLPKGIHQYNCTRARAGWTGDLVGLARAYRYADGVAGNDGLAARLFSFRRRPRPSSGSMEISRHDAPRLGRDAQRGGRTTIAARIR
jgi:hypothetical protein